MNRDDSFFRTGITGNARKWHVSPDGRYILFNAGKTTDGLLLLGLVTRKVSRVPGEPGRFWEMANWSHDGKQVVAISTAIRNNRYQVGEQEVILIDPRDWHHRKLAATEGVNIFPFFSADGTTVYYFKGQKRDSGATLASRFDLYAYDLVTNRETRLTQEKIYQVGPGHDDGTVIMFSADGVTRIPSVNPNSRRHEVQRGLYVFDRRSHQFRHFEIDQSDGFFELSFGDKDAAHNIYFRAAKLPPGGGRFVWFIYRCNPEGRACTMLTDTQIGSSVKVAADTNNVFVSAVQNDEIIFQRLTVSK